MFIRHKIISGYRYYYVVETVVEDGKMKQHVVKYLGSVEKILSVFGEHEKNKIQK